MSTFNKPAPSSASAGIGGHPKGLYYLAFTEAWERFSYYGMTALLVLYMVNELLLPGHVENIVGFAGFRAAVESLFGPLSTQALASQIFGLYAGFVYLTPLFGGWIADRWIGQRNAVVIGALCMSGGHLAMAFEQSFLLALVLLVVGSGFLKGNISAQVGALYPRDEEALRTRGFAIFSVAINVGAVTGPLLTGLLAKVYGWHYGFGMAAIFMLAGLATYLVGYRHLPARVERCTFERDRLTAADRGVILALVAVMLISIFQSVAYYQLANVLPVWIQAQVALEVGSFTIPVPWYQSIDPLFSILGVPLLFWIWRKQAERRREPGDLAKIGIGAWLAALSNLILVAAILIADGAPVHPVWPMLYCAGMGIAFLYYWPTLLALVSRTAPASVNATMMGVAFTTLFVANNLIGWIGGYYERMTPAQFWGLHAAIGATGGVLVLLFGGMLTRALAGGAQQPLRASAQTIEVER
ncbi:MAG: peptide MFS transporter [Rhodanobacteraceae bacterium]|nr:peptide MFS transporter [Rhodanobacteraceae bacterium]